MGSGVAGQEAHMEDDLEDLYEGVPATSNLNPTDAALVPDASKTSQMNDTATKPQLPGITDQDSSNFTTQKKEDGPLDAEIKNNNSSDNQHKNSIEDSEKVIEQDKLVSNGTQPSIEEYRAEPRFSTDVTVDGNTASTNEAAHEPLANGSAEWEIDSSPYESSSDDSSDTTSSDSDEDYEMLDPAEQARRLMEGDANSDDEGGSRETKGANIKSHNEQQEEPIVKPEIVVTEDMSIEILGAVETLVDNVALIKAKISGEYQVLEAGSLLCLSSRTVIGVVSETLGRVQQPLYCVRFESAPAITEAGIAIGTTIYYVPQHSTFVFTKALQAVKGSDASNIHDEEVAGDEIEFSDDEAEAAYKRNVKAERRERRLNKPGQRTNGYSQSRDGEGAEAPTYVNYDDEPQDDLYTPLTRPSNLHEMMNGGAGRGNDTNRSLHGVRGRGDRRGGRNHRGRGDRGRGRSEQHTHRAAPPSRHFPQSPVAGSPTSPWGQDPSAYGMPPNPLPHNMNPHFNGPTPNSFNQPATVGPLVQQLYQHPYSPGQYSPMPAHGPPHYYVQQQFGQQPQYYPPPPPPPPPLPSHQFSGPSSFIQPLPSGADIRDGRNGERPQNQHPGA